jgi:pimeloyl-ACP methyl ester carboxylesterase
MATLTGTNRPVDLGGGYALRAPGLKGDAQLRHGGSAPTRAAVRGLDAGLDALDDALRAAQVTEVRQVALDLKPVATGPASGVTLRSAQNEPAIELQVPDLGAEFGQLVLSIDGAGALRWHLPEPDAPGESDATTRGGGGVKRFVIPAVPTPAVASPGATQRSVLGEIGKRLLKVLIYPITDPIVGAVGEFFAERWEAWKRPYGLRSFTPQNFRSLDVPLLTMAELQAMRAGGPALLFIHGTFSNAHGAFAGMPDVAFEELHRRYGGRVFAFNHYSMSHSPQRNVEWLLEQLPPADAAPWPIDIVCHSRGGLVARTLAESPSPFGLDTARLAVRRVVLAGVPNAGTLLAQPEHMVHMLDRLTTALLLFPTGPVTEFIEALLTVLKVIGHGALKGLDGLASMNPEGSFIPRLNIQVNPPPDYFAIAADYEPTDAGLRGLVWGAADIALDTIFKSAGNDLVVPTDGVFSLNGGTGFPVRDDRLLKLGTAEGVMHTTLFAHPVVNERLLQWLTVG